jgi:hypothetical protein
MILIGQDFVACSRQKRAMNERQLAEAIVDLLGKVDVQVASRESGAPEIAWGDVFLFYAPDGEEPDRRFPFATIVTKDYPGFDEASALDRPGVFRLNIGLGKETYRSLFGAQPGQPLVGAAVHTGHDYAALDRLIPHPVYAPQSWVSVLNPSAATFASIRPLLIEAHALAGRRHARRTG